MLTTHYIFVWFKNDKNETEKLIERMKERNMSLTRYARVANYFPIPYIRSINESLILEKGISIDKFIEKVKIFYGGEKNIKKIFTINLPSISHKT